METLPLTFTESNWHHEQVCRTKDYALYKRWKDTSHAPHWEVIEIGQFKEKKMFDKTVAAHEYYPGATNFGVSAWTFPTMELAQARYDELTKPVIKKAIKRKPSVD